MSEALDQLAEAYGVSLGYVSERGSYQRVSDRAKMGVLKALAVAAETEAEISASLAAAPRLVSSEWAEETQVSCFVPDWLQQGRAWGITCQLYGLRSARNWGIGDFEDLARLAECAGACGADFVGVNPLHALFLAQPARCSPYAPSSRRFINPLYVAVDKLEGADAPAGSVEVARAAPLVDYVTVASLKRAALAALFDDFRARHVASRTADAVRFESFCEERGRALELFALFEALSAFLVAQGHPCGWHCWPEVFRSPRTDQVRRFAQDHSASLLFHKWLQWIADAQLADAQRRARAAGMRIGLYLDLAVGAAPDGADTWSDPQAVVTGASIGSPPDAFNALGQDWGLAPLSPTTLSRRGGAPFRTVVGDLMRHAGAVRIDHAMGLVRLYWIASGCAADDGAYVAYPALDMLRQLTAASQQCSALVIGEDLGTVPEGFRETMRRREIHGYRVLYFERGEDGEFRPPEAYTREALSCISTHDLPTLRGWWSGSDIVERARLGLCGHETADAQHSGRARDRGLLLEALARAGLLPQELGAARADVSSVPEEIPGPVIVGLHAFLARTPSRLAAVQLEDLVGMVEQANVPGTVDEHPNWRRKLPLELEEIPQAPEFKSIVRVMANERPRTP